MHIIYKSSFEKIKLSINDLKPYSQVIYGFIGEGLSPTRTMKLAVTAGDMPNHFKVMTEFLIVDCSFAYNVVLGRPLLMALQAAVSIWHLTMKFPTSVGIGCTRGDQREARECYNASISKARRGAENNMVANSGEYKGPLGKEGAVEMGDHERRKETTIIHQAPLLGGDGASPRADI